MPKRFARLARQAFTLLAAAVLLLSGFGFPGAAGTGRAYASSTVPALTVTEILANSNGDSGSITDSYEYVELRNNTGGSIDLAGYKFIFWYTPTASVTWDLTTSQTLAAGAVRVVWIKNTYAQGKTLANFNSHYGTSFTSSTLYTLDLGANGGLGNTGFKKLIVATDAGTEVSIAKYNDRIATSTTLDEDAVMETAPSYTSFPTTSSTETSRCAKSPSTRSRRREWCQRRRTCGSPS